MRLLADAARAGDPPSGEASTFKNPAGTPAPSAGGKFYFLTDHLGGVVAVLDGSGAMVGEQRYRPFGQPRLTPGIAQTDLGFTGQQSLPAAGLQDFNARWFNTSLGMFTSPDSLITDAFDPQGLSRYGYVFSNPLRYTDPSGHRPCEYDLDACRPAPAPVAVRGTTAHGSQTLAGGGTGSSVVTQAFEILNEDRQSLTSGDAEVVQTWSMVATLLDTAAGAFNTTYALAMDAAAVSAPPVAGILAVAYKPLSVIPNTISTISFAIWTGIGISSHESQVAFDPEQGSL